MAPFWFLAGTLTTLAILVMLLPQLRDSPRVNFIATTRWRAAICAALMLAAALPLGMNHWRAPAPGSAPGALNIRDVVSTVSGNAGAGAASANSAANSRAGSMDSAIAALEGKLAQGNGSPDDWELLAKSFEFLGRPEEARMARARQLPPLPATPPAAVASAPTLSADSLEVLAKADRARHEKRLTEAAALYAGLAARGQMNADSWADYADTAASLQGGKLKGAPENYLAQALALDPRHPKALWLEASADEEAGRFAAAAAAWQRLQSVLPPDSEDARIVAANLQQDLKLAGTGSAGTGTTVSGEISLAAGLSAKAAAGATLFIIAKSAGSPGPPVAVFRTRVGAWPVKFTLDDSQSMIAGRDLSSAGRVTVEARISQSGQPLPAAGDLQGSSGTIDPAEHRALKILIDHVIP